MDVCARGGPRRDRRRAQRRRRHGAQQINHAYAVLLASQFQGFCRDLHTESANLIASAVQPAVLRTVMLDRLIQGRKLDSENPNPGNIGEDFLRFGVRFWPEVSRDDRRNPARQALLAELNQWRNAIARQDFTRIGSPSLRLQQVSRWRAACQGLAQSFDAVLGRAISPCWSRRQE